MTLLPVEDAQARLLARATPITRTETVGLMEADGRRLAADVTARLTQPPFDASAMDGYALRAEDAPAVGSEFTVMGESAAGHAFEGSVGPGEAVRIFTGAPVPAGATSVLLQEDAEVLSGNRIRTTFAVQPGRHIRPRGQDFAEGEVVLAKDCRLDFARLTLAAAANHATLDVYRRPLVALLATGDELVRPGEAPGPSQIIGSNTFGIAALAREAGAEVLDLGIVPDQVPAIAAAVEKARTAGADVLVTLGGASVGDHDLVQKTLVDCGMVLDFWKIAMRPGKPLMVGSLGDMHVLGLPGNPVSSMVCGLLFLEPLLLTLSGRSPLSRERMAVSETAMPANDRRQDYVRATLRRDADGRLLARSHGKQDSSMMKIFAKSECLIIRPPHAPALEAGSPCPVLLLRSIDS
ncbi:molybdopterin molybdotransferase MoeA [Ciceribacter sp. L1K23]|uniref:molybdopterin molybdotransferase MoeA n=1 Tax=Ciceribacter sp. L1K23 TaxID=2820276 RepID=UPI001B81F27E|nr:gephyrin-like molybdotransferase Glp [Ciceribacter sp. L1K23]MBR0555651.1 molybdopterin molybdotransferase MoeA [Ciceribacter sp. L1K23]